MRSLLNVSSGLGGLVLADSRVQWQRLHALCPHATFGLRLPRATTASASRPPSLQRPSTQLTAFAARSGSSRAPGQHAGVAAAPAAVRYRRGPPRNMTTPAVRDTRLQAATHRDREDDDVDNDDAQFDGRPRYAGRGGSSSDYDGRGGRASWPRRAAPGRARADPLEHDDDDDGDGGSEGGDEDSGGEQRRWRRSVPPTAAGPLSRSRRVALLRKPAMTAADKTYLPPEERRRIFWALRTPKGTRPGSFSRSQPPPSAPPSPLLRVFCHGIDDVRLYRALSEAGALGRVVVAASVGEADAVLAVRIKRTGRAVSMDLVTRSARKAGKPLLELPAISAVRVMEAVQALTGWPVPAHLRRSPTAPGGVAYLPALEPGTDGAAEALVLMAGGHASSLAEYLALRGAGQGGGGGGGPSGAAAWSRAVQPAPELVAELDAADVYDSREADRPANPQDREARRQPALSRPHMPGSRQERIRLRLELERRAAEEAGLVDW